MGAETETWDIARRQIRNLLVSAVLYATSREILHQGMPAGRAQQPQRLPRPQTVRTGLPPSCRSRR